MNTENKIYNPAAQPKQWLIEHFVVRTKVFDKLFKDILTGKMKYPEQHYLIQGQRGMGKTTLLLRLKYEIENTPDLNTWLVPVFFNEESYDLTSLSNLWEKLLKYLDDLWQTGGSCYKKTDDFLGKPDYEKKCFDHLVQILKDKEKKLILFFDNFGQLFLDNLKEKEQHRLREILMNCAEIRVIGTSAIVLKDLHDYSKPFFEFFKIINLEGLNKIETFDLIKKLQEKSDIKVDLEKNKAKIETLAILTGGVIRTIMLIYESILADQDGTALKDLEMILDRITPLYKHRIEDLPVQQRRIVDVIAKNWDAISAKDIASNIREDGQQMATKTISAQLQQLEKNNVIEKKQTNTKNHLYQLRERFFNIWYLMRHGDRYDKCRVVWLTKLLEMWYEDSSEFHRFLERHIKHLRSGKYNTNSAILISEALVNSKKIDILSLELLLKETSAILDSEQKKKLPDINIQKIERAELHFRNSEFEKVIEILNTLDDKPNIIKIMLANCYLQLGQNNESLEIIKKIEPNNDNDRFGLAYLYRFLGKYSESNSLLFGNKYDIGQSNYFIAQNYISLGLYSEAIKFLLESIKYTPDAYISLVEVYIGLKQYKRAESFAKEGIQKGVKELTKSLSYIYLIHYTSKQKQKLAYDMIDKELNTDPNDPDYNYLLGTYTYFNGETKSTLALFSKAAKLYNDQKIENVYWFLNIHMLLSVSIDTRNKKKCLEIITSQKIPPSGSLLLLQSFIYTWNNDFRKGYTLLLECVSRNDDESLEKETSFLTDLIMLFFSKKQFHSILNIFEIKSINLKDRLKPLYFALMHYLKEEYPNEILKMGEELKQPVEDIMKRVEEMAIDYK